jgi:hypothetical protein
MLVLTLLPGVDTPITASRILFHDNDAMLQRSYGLHAADIAGRWLFPLNTTDHPKARSCLMTG